MNLDRVIAVRTTKTVYRDGDLCIKVFNKEFTKADVLHEALNQAIVEGTGLNVPKIKEVTTINGKWAIASEFIDGKTLSALMKENPDKNDEYLDLFVSLQLEVLSKSAPDLIKLKDKINRNIGRVQLDATTRYDLHTRLESMPKHTRLCHGDFVPSNIIITPEGTPFITDWAHASQGNATADAAITYLALKLNGDTETAKKYIEKFCEKCDRPRKYVQKWIPIIAASQSVKCNEHDRERLLSWSNVVDYE